MMYSRTTAAFHSTRNSEMQRPISYGLPPCSTVIQCILEQARLAPNNPSVRILHAEREDSRMTYADLIQNATHFAHFFKVQGVGKGEVVILILNHGAELIYAFVGALLIGAVPSIFAFPSAKVPADVYWKTMTRLLKVSEAHFLLTDSELANRLEGESMMNRSTRILRTDQVQRHSDSPEDIFCIPDPSDIVLLQHSSGTTGLKKGVALSHESILNQIRHYAEALALDESDRIASWLPLYHDMGLVACLILPLVCGIPVTLMSPFDWVANPILFFRTIHEDRATLSWLPNFAYHFLASKIQESQMKGIDLSSVRAFINCAEPISASSHELFFTRFKKNGLSKKHFPRVMQWQKIRLR